MHFFKYETGQYRSPEWEQIINKLGPLGPLYYIILLDLCAERFDYSHLECNKLDFEALCNNFELSPSLTAAVTFRFGLRQLSVDLRVKPARVRLILAGLQDALTPAIWFSEPKVGEFDVIFPKILLLLDNNKFRSGVLKQRFRHSGATVAPKSKSKSKKKSKDLDLDLEKEKDLNTDANPDFVPKSDPVGDSTLEATDISVQIWNTYSEGYLNKYNTAPVINAKVRSQISQLGKRLGRDAVEVVKFYLQHPDAFYNRTLHSVGPLLKDCESLHSQWKIGRPSTYTSARSSEQFSAAKTQMERILAGEI